MEDRAVVKNHEKGSTTTCHPLQDFCMVSKTLKAGGMITPVKIKQKIASGLDRDVMVMNSTAQCSEENRPNITCELSSINATMQAVPHQKYDLMEKIEVETPAKIFARMKAKVLRQNSAGYGPPSENRELCGGGDGVISKPGIQSSKRSKANQETYILAVSPPLSDNEDLRSEEVELSNESLSISESGRQSEVLAKELHSFIEPFTLLEKMPMVLERRQKEIAEKKNDSVPRVMLKRISLDESFTQLQQKPIGCFNGLKDKRNKGGCFVFSKKNVSSEKDVENDLEIESGNSVAPKEYPITIPKSPQPIQNLLDDPLMQLSPCVSLPKKQWSVPRAKRLDAALDSDTPDEKGICLRNWILKLLNKDLVVDGIRTDSKIPWHSSSIVERVTCNKLKTSSGNTYVLVGKMAKTSDSPFPPWFLNKFHFGFPQTWKDDLDQFFSGFKGSETDQNNASVMKAPKTQKQRLSKKSKHVTVQNTASCFTPVNSVLQASEKVSRSGRVIKPPLDYWKGGRVVLDHDMNVTIHEDYSRCTSVLSLAMKPSSITTSNTREEQSDSSEELERETETSQRDSDALRLEDSLTFPSPKEVKKTILERLRKRKGSSEPKTNHQQVSSENTEDDKCGAKIAHSKSRKLQSKKDSNTEENELFAGKWTDEELQKLHEAVNSLPKHKDGYWAHVASVVGPHSAEDCHEQMINQTNIKTRKRASKKPAATAETDKKMVEITARAGTLKRKQQMRHFLEHMPKDDHDDVFASSPVHCKQIKIPVSAENVGEDLGMLQNPQTPTSWMFASAKTPKCLHINPGLQGSINKNNIDRYIVNIQKNKKRRNQGKKAVPMGMLSPAPVVKKTLKRCVAEDEDFVVWNMLSDKEAPSREDDSDEEDDYLMDY
ncbi:hypothetical protein DNTS_027329 [Danionella cerebrum]|uniref:Myb-like domain-containing protein n=1 Tax=Danionella cerebrum TaxID=2873325 RepID=A0A553QVU7_9TELE|nr:hypothetical protein DNTS_027329 [Danionella translucida]